MDIAWTKSNGTQLTDGGDLDFCTGDDEVKASVSYRMHTWRGGWYYDIQEGIDWIGILSGPTDETTLTAVIRGELSRLFGSDLVDYVRATRDAETRTVTLIAEIDGHKVEASFGD